jgi:hypothetical protein
MKDIAETDREQAARLKNRRWYLMPFQLVYAADAPMILAQYVRRLAAGPKCRSTTNVKTSPMETTTDGLWGSLRFIAAIKKEATSSRIQMKSKVAAVRRHWMLVTIPKR